jgi:hypothetical protein
VIQDGNPTLIQAASVSIHKAHGQYIENIHLETYESEAHFWDVLYKNLYSRLIRRAEEFIESTGGPGEDVLVFIRYGHNKQDGYRSCLYRFQLRDGCLRARVSIDVQAQS